MKVGFLPKISFTKDIERFSFSRNKSFEIVIGIVKSTFGLTLKVVRTNKDVKFTKDLINHNTGVSYAGSYRDRNISSYYWRKHNDGTVVKGKSKIFVRLPANY